jgi:DNA polymerase
MADDPSLNPDEVSRQVRRHVESLRAAGVDWVPASPENPTKPTDPSAAPAVSTARSLFESDLGTGGGAASVELMPLEERRRALELLAERVSTCPRCAELASTRTQTVFGVGKLDTELCFIGEAPGADEDARGEPFVGAAGQLLNRIIAACGMKREEVYICNILKCRPPGNRAPLPHEAANCREYLDKQLELVRPRFICALGASAAQNLLNTKASIGRLRGQFLDYRGIPVLCTYHPAFLLRSPDKKRDVWEDMKKLLRRMGRPVP